MADKDSSITLRGTEVSRTKLKMSESEDADGFGEHSLTKKIKVFKSHSVDGSDRFETVWADAIRELNLLFSKYSEVLRRLYLTDLMVSGCVEHAHRERAGVDESQVQELTDILREAVSLESQLKEKKEHLRQALAIISDKLQK